MSFPPSAAPAAPERSSPVENWAYSSDTTHDVSREGCTRIDADVRSHVRDHFCASLTKPGLTDACERRAAARSANRVRCIRVPK